MNWNRNGVVVLTATMMACGGGTVDKVESFEERSSYAVGMDIGRSLSQTGAEFEQDALFQGIRDVLMERDLLLTDEEQRSLLQELSARMQQSQMEERTALAEQNLKEGQEFLAANKEREGITTTESGLQYEVLEEGDGPHPTAAQRVRVHYRGTFTDGSQFESSYDTGNPVEFAVGEVIAGWAEGLQLMSVGSKYRFFIPSDLAYGEMGSRRGMEPNRTLIFEVELLEIL